MKKPIYLLIFIALCIFSCKKEEKPPTFSIKNEYLFINTTKVLFHVEYEYPSVLSEIKIHLATKENMSNASVHNATINGKQFTASIGELQANATYFYLYEYFSGTTSIKSNVKSFENKPEVPVEINGVKWAPCNVSVPDFFANKPYDSGMLYQWGSNVGWSSSNPLTATDGNNNWRDLWDTGDAWQTSKDPCPPGWRVPTYEELQSLTNESKVSRTWTTENGVNGYRFTDKATGSFLFLPAAGYRDYIDGSLYVFVDSHGIYWSSMPGSDCDDDCAYIMDFFSEDVFWFGFLRAYGFSIRCVADLK